MTTTTAHITSIDLEQESWPHAGRRGKTVTVYRATCACGWKDNDARKTLREARAYAKFHRGEGPLPS